jgi:NAD(P)H dehydrogenase (quinone)
VHVHLAFPKSFCREQFMPVNLLIAFYSRGGVTEALALGVAEGARAAGADVRLRRVPDIVSEEIKAKVSGWKEHSERMLAAYGPPTIEDATWADAIVFGTPTRFGNVSAELKAYIDSLGGLWFQGVLNGKAGGVFGSSSTIHGGNESTLLSLYHPLAHLGFIIVPTGYAHPTLFKAGSPYGATSVSYNKDAPPTEDDLVIARFQGQRTVEVAAALKQVRPTK